MHLPPVVTPNDWQTVRDELLAEEKEATRALDALAAKRRRLPMVRIDKEYVFEGPDGPATLADLFEGRRQLIVYHFMFGPGWERPCEGCSSFTDNIGNLAHLNARDTTMVLVSRAPQSQIQPLKARMGWSLPWYSSNESDFNFDFGVTTEDGDERFGLSVFLRDECPGRRPPQARFQSARPHPAGPAGDMGGLARGLAADTALRVVAAPRRIRGRSGTGRVPIIRTWTVLRPWRSWVAASSGRSLPRG